MLGSILITALMYYARFNKTKRAKIDLIWICCVFTILRQMIRCFDYEESIHEMPSYDWHILVILKIMISNTTMLIMANSFDKTKSKVIMYVGCAFFITISAFQGVYEEYEMTV